MSTDITTDLPAGAGSAVAAHITEDGTLEMLVDDVATVRMVGDSARAREIVIADVVALARQRGEAVRLVTSGAEGEWHLSVGTDGSVLAVPDVPAPPVGGDTVPSDLRAADGDGAAQDEAGARGESRSTPTVDAVDLAAADSSDDAGDDPALPDGALIAPAGPTGGPTGLPAAPAVPDAAPMTAPPSGASDGPDDSIPAAVPAASVPSDVPVASRPSVVLAASVPSDVPAASLPVGPPAEGISVAVAAVGSWSGPTEPGVQTAPAAAPTEGAKSESAGTRPSEHTIPALDGTGPDVPTRDAEDDLDEELERTVVVPPRARTVHRATLHTSSGTSITITGSGVIGRRPTRTPNPVRFPDADASMSNAHAAFSVVADGLLVTDQGSLNGTVVQHDGLVTECVPGRPVHVPRGGRVDLGEQFFIVV
ncbi:FHA domain-containing protein [Curtobacterium sp. MCBD17_032]|uniref:FHA domain-containing protein n=1 Tax=Curtobacterium sp. MCBD17_032 TaxID=2175659 RepID=UPI000DA9DE3F|nr:FHA domain-containing protein [Curtobacterium sp. MCBD17_032]PZE83353.1 hypothetical protein DEI91_10690 [Curtobacterium sp. MCBD17_032]